VKYTRIVSLSPSVTETLIELGLEDEIVGVTPWCRLYLRNPVDKEIAGTYTYVPIDKLKKLNPDIVFLQSRVHDKIFHQVKSAEFNVYLVPLPTNVNAIISHIVLDIGAIVGRYYESRELADKLTERIAEIIRRKGREKRIRTYIEYLWPDKTYSTAGSLTYIDDGVRIAGGENIFYDTPKEFFNPRNEDIIERNPELVIVNIEPEMNKITLEEYKSIRKELSTTKAFKENKIILVVESRYVNLAHFGPSFISTIEWLSTKIQSLNSI
jgi:iron complex transport system substrate-binding protein